MYDAALDHFQNQPLLFFPAFNDIFNYWAERWYKIHKKNSLIGMFGTIRSLAEYNY